MVASQVALRQQGYTGGYTILKDFVRPLRRRVTSHATMRFETAPGEQAQVDFGSFAYRTADGKVRRVWGFVMVLSWSRAIYVEFVSRSTTETFSGECVDSRRIAAAKSGASV